MKHHTIPATEKVGFWCWISPSTIALVTTTSVYHWSMEGDSKPQKWFDRSGDQMTDAHVLGYRVSEDLKWAVIYGIKKVHRAAYPHFCSLSIMRVLAFRHSSRIQSVCRVLVVLSRAACSCIRRCPPLHLRGLALRARMTALDVSSPS